MRRNDTSASKLGIFQLATELREAPSLPGYAYNQLKYHQNWLNKHLKSPDILDELEHHRAISWFKPAAKVPLSHIWGIKTILEEAGYHIEIVKTRNPGHIIYEDGWQIVAKPERKDGKIR